MIESLWPFNFGTKNNTEHVCYDFYDWFKAKYPCLCLKFANFKKCRMFLCRVGGGGEVVFVSWQQHHIPFLHWSWCRVFTLWQACVMCSVYREIGDVQCEGCWVQHDNKDWHWQHWQFLVWLYPGNSWLYPGNSWLYPHNSWYGCILVILSCILAIFGMLVFWQKHHIPCLHWTFSCCSKLTFFWFFSLVFVLILFFKSCRHQHTSLLYFAASLLILTSTGLTHTLSSMNTQWM